MQNGCKILHSQQQWDPVSLNPRQHLILSLFLILAILRALKWYLIVVLVCISLMADDVDHFFMYFFAISIFLIKYLFTSFAYFLIGLFEFLSLCFGALLPLERPNSPWCVFWHHPNGEGALHSARWGRQSTLPTWSPRTLYGPNGLLPPGGDENSIPYLAFSDNILVRVLRCPVTASWGWKSRLPLSLCWHV